MNILEEIRREFGNDIERVEHLLRLIKGFRGANLGLVHYHLQYPIGPYLGQRLCH